MNRLHAGLIFILYITSPISSFCCVTVYGLGQGDEQNSVELCVAEDTAEGTFDLYNINEESQNPEASPLVFDQEE